MERNLMTINQMKFFLVDFGKDHIMRDFLSPHKKEVVVCLTDFIRLVNSDIEPKGTDSASIIRALTKGTLPIVLYRNLANRAKPIVTMMDWLREKISKDVDTSIQGINDIHEEIYSKYSNIIDRFLIEYGKDISMFYECFLYNVVLMNMRTIRIPYLQYKEYGQIGYNVPVYPIKVVPKFGPEIAILLNPDSTDFPTFNIMRDRMQNSLELMYCSLSGDCSKLDSLPTKKPKFDYLDLLYSNNIDPADISKSEEAIITHAARTTDDAEIINEVTSSVMQHQEFILALRFLIADLEGTNENNLKYLVDFE